MLLRRLPLLSALLLLLLSAARCRPPESRSLLEPPGRYPRTRSELPAQGARQADRGSRTHRGLEGHSRDPRHKEKFIIHLTGPLYFNPKCRKHFNRLYHNTRDCTIPAYYKRCARLLTRLANSPRCTER